MNIDIQQPAPFDLVGQEILIAGNAVGFEGTLSVMLTEGHDQFDSFVNAGSLMLRQFQGSVTVPDDIEFKLSRLFLTVADDTAGGEGGPPPSVTLSVLYGPLILPGYTGYRERTVVAGDTLSAIAADEYGDASMFGVIQQANQHIVPDANLIVPGMVLRVPRNDG
ncbi:Gmad2 immunoglobulin-like domain-containing protein [Pseudahrensia aquimaris]|uniref:Gmad2 immunoglobulin-like domain-containing protein n=1 Tax=Pseudahrensia aquimaris TaxID=744461 RepID=A0ABW3FDA1_9HYPH